MAENNTEYLYAKRLIAHDRATEASLKLTTLAAIRALGANNKHTSRLFNNMGVTLLGAKNFIEVRRRSERKSITSVVQVKDELVKQLPSTYSAHLGGVAVTGVIALGPESNRAIALELSSDALQLEQELVYEGLATLYETEISSDIRPHITLARLEEKVDIEWGAHIPAAEVWMPPTVELQPVYFGPDEFLRVA